MPEPSLFPTETAFPRFMAASSSSNGMFTDGARCAARISRRIASGQFLATATSPTLTGSASECARAREGRTTAGCGGDGGAGLGAGKLGSAKGERGDGELGARAVGSEAPLILRMAKRVRGQNGSPCGRSWRWLQGLAL